MSVFCIFRRHSIALVRNRQISHHRTCPRQAGLLELAELDYEQPLFFRSPSSVKQKKKERAKTGDEGSGSEARKNVVLRFRSPRPQFSRALFFLLHVRRTAKK